MAGISAAAFVAHTDKLAAVYLAILGTAASGFGCGDGNATLAADWGYSKKSREYEQLVLTSGDRDLINALLSNASQAVDNAPAASLAYSLLYPRLYGIDRLCAASGLTGVTGIVSFASYYNTGAGGPWASLLSPEFAALYAICFPGNTVPAVSVYAPPDVNMGSRSVGGALVLDAPLDEIAYAGAARAQVTVAGSTWGAPGFGTVEVVGRARTALGTVASGRSFTRTGVPFDGAYYLDPVVAGDLLIEVTDIILPPAMTAGSVTITTHAPLGRTSPPV